jgi:hypothetical protein
MVEVICFFRWQFLKDGTAVSRWFLVEPQEDWASAPQQTLNTCYLLIIQYVRKESIPDKCQVNGSLAAGRDRTDCLNGLEK